MGSSGEGGSGAGRPERLEEWWEDIMAKCLLEEIGLGPVGKGRRALRSDI